MTPIIIEPEVPSPGSGQNLQELMEEVFAQGFDDFQGDAEKEARIKRWLNISYQEVSLFKDWPFLETEWEGTLPEEFPNLGHVLSVVDPENHSNLLPADRRELLRFDPTLEGTGNIGERWYRTGNEEINVYPSMQGHTYKVRYIVVPNELTEETDEPLIPPRFQYLIVDGAIMRAYRSRDAYDAASLVQERWNSGMATMVKSLMNVNHDRSKKIIRTGFGGSWRSGYWG